MDTRKPIAVARRLIVPLVLAVTAVGAAAVATTSVGCHNGKPTVDANRDGIVDTPIV